jgi:2,3-bisphosphoglycerate-independent phosphoglycerate mutase
MSNSIFNFPLPGCVVGKRVVLVLIDGIADVSLKQLNHKTPIEHARTPFFDAVAGAGCRNFVFNLKTPEKSLTI